MKCKEPEARTSDVCLPSILLAFTVLLGCRGLFVFAAALEELKSIFVVLICCYRCVVALLLMLSWSCFYTRACDRRRAESADQDRPIPPPSVSRSLSLALATHHKI